MNHRVRIFFLTFLLFSHLSLASIMETHSIDSVFYGIEDEGTGGVVLMDLDNTTIQPTGEEGGSQSNLERNSKRRLSTSCRSTCNTAVNGP